MEARSSAFRIFYCSFAAAGLAACGGGGGGGAAALPPVAALPTTAPAGSGSASVAFTIAIPSATTSSTRRSPRYVSAGTKSVLVAFAGKQQSADCTQTCSVNLTVPQGAVTFQVGLYDAKGGTGNLLATGSTTTTVVLGQANTVSITFGGVVASVGIALGTASVTAGTAAVVPITVTAKDAAGFTIVGAEPYSAPIVLAHDDTSGATSLSTTSVAAPGAPVSLSYNGSAAFATAHVTATVPGTGVVPQLATLRVQQVAAATPSPSPSPAPPSGTALDHVRSLTYFGLNDLNSAIPASYMAKHADIVEDDGFTADHARAFKLAGGAFAETYTDPTFVPYCVPPFTEPAGKCSGPVGNLVANDPSAWIHDKNGARIYRQDGSPQKNQEMLNIASASAQNAYAATTAAIFQATPQIDIVEADDSGGEFTRPDLGVGSNYYGGWSGFGMEITADAAWIAAETAMLAKAGRPVILNGSSVNQGPAYNGAFLDQSNVIGQMFEGYINNVAGYLYAGGQYATEQNGVLAVQAHRKWAIIMPTGDTSPANRLYAYASFMLVYDPQYSVYAQVVQQSDGYALYPEVQLVPAQPRATATSDVATLSQGGVYVREFASCTIAGVSIGACAAAVNASSSATAALPASLGTYARHITLDAASIYTGGKANVVSGGVSSLGAKSAVILVK
jgi:hypothetical protein